MPSSYTCEPLEDRLLLSVLPPPDPISPTRGESNLLRVVQMLADKQNLNAQDHFPVPFTIVASAGGAAPTIVNWKAGPVHESGRGPEQGDRPRRRRQLTSRCRSTPT